MSNRGEVTVSKVVDASPESVWEVTGEPGDISDWHPAIDSSEASPNGDRRRCELADGGTLEEEIVARDPSEYEYTYRIESSPMPLDRYVSTFRLESENGGTRIEWTAEFETDGPPGAELEKEIQGIYEAGLRALQGKFGD